MTVLIKYDVLVLFALTILTELEPNFAKSEEGSVTVPPEPLLLIPHQPEISNEGFKIRFLLPSEGIIVSVKVEEKLVTRNKPNSFE